MGPELNEVISDASTSLMDAIIKATTLGAEQEREAAAIRCLKIAKLRYEAHDASGGIAAEACAAVIRQQAD